MFLDYFFIINGARDVRRSPPKVSVLKRTKGLKDLRLQIASIRKQPLKLISQDQAARLKQKRLARNRFETC
jgi:hypothetical protein